MINDVPSQPEEPTDDTWINRALKNNIIDSVPVIDLTDDPYERLNQIREKMDVSLDLAMQLSARITSLVQEAREIINNLPGYKETRR